MDLQQKKRERFDFLNKLYDQAGGSTNAAFNITDIGQELQFSYDQTRNTADYLTNEGLIEPYAIGGSITITHYGIKEIEQAYEKPELPTEHFGPVNHIHIHSFGQGAIINTGNNNTFAVTNNFNKTAVMEKAQEVIEKIENDPSVYEKDKANAISILNQLVIEAHMGTPKNSTVNKVLTIGANIASVGSLIIALFQLFTNQS